MRARNTQLDTAVMMTAGKIDPRFLKEDSLRCVPGNGLGLAQQLGIRDELVYALPCMLRQEPALIGYYRMLLGYSLKQFYATESGLSSFREMEEGIIPQSISDEDLLLFCSIFNDSMSEFLVQAKRDSIIKDLRDLPIMTLGVYVDGVWRNRVGQGAAESVASSMLDILTHSDYEKISGDAPSEFVLLAPDGFRRFRVHSASDPDIAVTEITNSSERKVLCIEVKGGQDVANVHNRAGEAEKSHQKAKRDGWPKTWTVILWSSLSEEQRKKIQVEAPTTDEWFDVNQVCSESGESYKRFSERLVSTL